MGVEVVRDACPAATSRPRILRETCASFPSDHDVEIEVLGRQALVLVAHELDSALDPERQPADAPMLANTPLMKLDRLGVAFGDRIVLTDVTFDVPAKGMLTIVGPAGAGKSALLRTLAGLNDTHPALTTWGEVSSTGGR